MRVFRLTTALYILICIYISQYTSSHVLEKKSSDGYIFDSMGAVRVHDIMFQIYDEVCEAIIVIFNRKWIFRYIMQFDRGNNMNN